MTIRPGKRRTAFALIELATTVAALVIILGLMVSLARHVRNRSAVALTRSLLVQLDQVLAQYVQANHGALPPVVPLMPPGTPPADDAALTQRAQLNNEAFVKALRRQADVSAKFFADLPLAVYDQVTVRDAWGNPVVLMPGMQEAIGMAPNNAPFFVSPGPDHRYLTREDNLLSYEQGGQ